MKKEGYPHPITQYWFI